MQATNILSKFFISFFLQLFVHRRVHLEQLFEALGVVLEAARSVRLPAFPTRRRACRAVPRTRRGRVPSSARFRRADPRGCCGFPLPVPIGETKTRWRAVRSLNPIPDGSSARFRHHIARLRQWRKDRRWTGGKNGRIAPAVRVCGAAIKRASGMKTGPNRLTGRRLKAGANGLTM